MSKPKLFIGVTLLLLAISFAWVRIASAHSFRSAPTVTIGQNEKIEQTIFAAGTTVDINSEVFGDIFCAGQNVTIAGTVHGDVICAGQTVNVNGKVDGDVRLAGQTVNIGADVTGNATITSQTFNLESTGKIGGDVSVGTQQATFNGSVGRDIAAGAQTMTIAGSVGRDVTGTVPNLTLTSGAHVTGNIEYSSNTDLTKAEGATVDGTVTRNAVAKKKGWTPVSYFAIWLYWLLAFVFMAMAIAFLFPGMLNHVTNRAIPRPWKALLYGFLASLAVPAVFIILLITVIGIPLAFVLLLFWLLIEILSAPVFAYYLGRLIMRNSTHALLIMLVGAAVLTLLYFIPFLGIIALVATVWIGTGMLIMELFDRTPRPTYNLAASSSRAKSRRTH